MTRAPRRALVLLVAALLGAAALAVVTQRAGVAPSARDKPVLLLLTSLPLVFGEQFALEGGGSPALTALETRYRVVPVSASAPAELARGRLLLMAQPLAQTAENLVALDDWVRRGGHLMLLADPMLDWPSERPLGDMLRPPPAFADTGLLAHWGLRLIGPESGGSTAGQLVSNGSCETAEDGAIARCRPGKGRATIIADADFLNVEPGEEEHLDPLMAELDRLENR